MSSYTVKNIPEDLFERLKQSSVAHNRSLNKEFIACLEKVLKPERLDVDEELATARRLREGVGFRVTEAELQRARNEGRK
jgi:plasmid stability protein